MFLCEGTDNWKEGIRGEHWSLVRQGVNDLGASDQLVLQIECDGIHQFFGSQEDAVANHTLNEEQVTSQLAALQRLDAGSLQCVCESFQLEIAIQLCTLLESTYPSEDTAQRVDLRILWGAACAASSRRMDGLGHHCLAIWADHNGTDEFSRSKSRGHHLRQHGPIVVLCGQHETALRLQGETDHAVHGLVRVPNPGLVKICSIRALVDFLKNPAEGTIVVWENCLLRAQVQRKLGIQGVPKASVREPRDFAVLVVHGQRDT
mmetsp:Transcript_31524/g.84130  ORF Transcript_31524/g.84130 Transcript_31524/m.84130 type:complete len:262 (+) Transcript_31524:2325-3110(+)